MLLATLWGGSYTFIKLGVATIPPVTLIAGRTLIAGLLLLLIMHWRGVRLPNDVATWCRFLFQACLNSVIPWTLIAWAERSVDAGLATILNSTSPIFRFFLTLAIAHQEALSWRNLFGVFSRGFKGLDPIAPAAGSLLCGAAILLPVSFVAERPWTLMPSTTSVLALLGLAIFSTAIAFVIYFRLIQTLGSVGTTAQAYLRVPIGVALGVLLLGEKLSPTAWMGLACVVIGVAAMTIPARKPAVANGPG